MTRRVLVVLLVGLGLALSGCRSREASLFEALYSSDFGLGIHFGWSSAQVRGVLGEPVAVAERQGTGTVDEHYYAVDETTDTAALDESTPQLTCTYQDDRLVRLFNRYSPEDEAQLHPPFFCEALVGVKLGNRKSDLVDALGPPTRELLGPEWRFKLRDGQAVSVAARFVTIPLIEEDLCSVLQIVYAASVEKPLGEDQGALDWRDLAK